MSSSNNHPHHNHHQAMSYENEVQVLKRRLEGWKLILLPVNNLLEWEHRRDPIVIICLDTLVFGLMMYYNPSILTTVAVLGLVVLFFETVVPFLSNYFFKSTEWDPVSESKYTRICERISNLQIHIWNTRVRLENIRREKQPLYFLIVFFFLVFCAYVGQKVDNFLLTYIAVLLLTLTPGARRRRLIPTLMRRIRHMLGMAPQPSPSTNATSKRLNATGSASHDSSSFESYKIK